MDKNTSIIVSKSKLLEVGAYFGHSKSIRNPKMKPYIARLKRDVYIIDIDKTQKAIQFAYDLIRDFAERGASFIFVGTRKQAKETIKKNALRTNSFYVSERWLGGTFTNSKTIFKRVKRMEQLEQLAEKNYEGYTKKEGLIFAHELKKLQRNLQGIRDMKNRPNIMIIADPSHDEIAVKEAKKVGVRTIGIVDTNNDPTMLDIAIPANDDSIKSVVLIITILADAIASQKGGEQLFAFKSDEEIKFPADLKKQYDQTKYRYSNQRRGYQDRRERRFNKNYEGSKFSGASRYPKNRDNQTHKEVKISNSPSKETNEDSQKSKIEKSN